MSKQISPPKGRYYFDGGLSTKFPKSLIDDNESPDCLNVEFSNGAVATRDGFAKLNTTAVGSFVCDGLYVRHTNTGGATMIAFAGGSAWTLDGSSTFVTIGSAQSVFTAGIRVAATEYQQHIFIGNGYVIPYKYNGVAFTRHGVYPATATASVASAATGAGFASAASYTYGFTYVNSQSVESSIGPKTTHVVAVNSMGNAALTSIPVAPQSFGVNARRIYRTTNGGSTYKLLTTISDNTTTTYEDNAADSTLGATAPTDNGVPPLYSTIVYHRDRLFCNDPSNPNFVIYSELQEPYTFAALNIRRFGDNTASIVRALAVDGENVVVFGDDTIEIIYMPDTDDTNWLNIRVKSDVGCKSPFGIVRYENGILFPATRGGKFVGFAHLKGDALAPSVTFLTVSSAGSFFLSDKVEPDMLTVKSSDVGEISGIVFENTAYFSVPYDSDATENNRVYVFDFTISNLSKKVPYSWAPWSGIYPAQMAIYNNTLYYGDGRANGFVFYQNDGVYADNGAAIDSYYWTKEFGGNEGEFNFHKDFRYANLLIDLAGNYQMNFTARVDSDTAAGNTQVISLDPGGSLWGTMEWGTDEWGGGFSQSEVRMDLGTLSGKRIQFKFDNQETVNQRFKVHGLNFLANVKGFR